jgi:hypothetical protein
LAELITHPDLGELRWDEQSSWWCAEFRLPSGQALGVLIDPPEDNRLGFIETAAKLFRWALKAEQRVLRKAIRAELLELYNDTWRQGDDRVLTAEDLASQLVWSLVELSASDIVPVTFNYRAGDLFGGHYVAVEVDAELRFRDIDLQG